MRSLKLGSWNIRKCVGLDRRRDPLRVAGVIAGLEADVMALQEADRRFGKRPAALTPAVIAGGTGLVPVDAGGHEGSLGWHGNAVLLRPGLRVEARQAMDLPGVEPRGALMLDIAGEDVAFRLVAVHLGLLRAARRVQLRAIHRTLEGMEPRPTVVLGDFNEWSGRRGLEPLRGFDVHAPGRSFHAARPVAALDRIATGAGVELRDAGVVESRVTRVASDHLPIWGNVDFSAGKLFS